MKSFNTPEEAIQAVNIECEASWTIFAASNKIEETIDPAAYKIAKMVFNAGFMSGARYVSGYIASKITKPNEEEINKTKVKGS
jgi:hypothetical protein